MQEALGNYFVKYSEPPQPENEGEEITYQDGNYTTIVPVAEAIPETVKYIGILYTANFAPPCIKFIEYAKKFYDEFSKDGLFELVILNCDRNEKEFALHLKQFDWCYAVPFDAPQSIIEGLEDKANAMLIPKLSIFSVEKGFDKFVVNDIKTKVLN